MKYQLTIEHDFKSTGGDELTFNSITYEEQHHACIYLGRKKKTKNEVTLWIWPRMTTINKKALKPNLILRCPIPDGWCLHIEPSKWILSTDNQHQGYDFGQAQNLSSYSASGRWRVIITLNEKIRVFLLDGVRELLKHLPIPSGIAEKKEKLSQ